jgi:hypothetical protein
MDMTEISPRGSHDWAEEGLRRAAFVEFALRWFGRVTQPVFMKAFRLGPATASKAFGDFMAARPGAMSKAGHDFRSGTAFRPRLVRGTSEEFLGVLRGQVIAHKAHGASEFWFSNVSIEDADRATEPPLSEEVLELLMQALDRKLDLHLNYASRSRREPRDFRFTPTHLVHALGRWHIRGFHHLDDTHRDVVVGRIRNLSLLGKADPRPDPDWETFVSLKFRINHDQPAEMQETLRREWNLDDEKDVVSVSCRKALQLYVNRKMLAPSSLGIPKWLKGDDPTQ